LAGGEIEPKSIPQIPYFISYSGEIEQLYVKYKDRLPLDKQMIDFGILATMPLQRIKF
jgi:hypothetical protein